MIFAEAVTELGQYGAFKQGCGGAGAGEYYVFGKTPPWTREELKGAGVDIVLYCCACAGR